MKVPDEAIKSIVDCFMKGVCPTCGNKPPDDYWCPTCVCKTINNKRVKLYDYINNGEGKN